MTEPELMKICVNPLDLTSLRGHLPLEREGRGSARLFRVGPSLSVELLGVTVGPAPLRDPPAASRFLQKEVSQTTAPWKGCPVVCPEGLESLSKLENESPYLSRPQHPHLLNY